MATEILATVDWQFWIPVGIAAASLILTFRQMRRSAKREVVTDLEKKIERAKHMLEECEKRERDSERQLQQCGHEKDELRREKVALLAQVAKMAKADD